MHFMSLGNHEDTRGLFQFKEEKNLKDIARVFVGGGQKNFIDFSEFLKGGRK